MKSIISLIIFTAIISLSFANNSSFSSFQPIDTLNSNFYFKESLKFLFDDLKLDINATEYTSEVATDNKRLFKFTTPLDDGRQLISYVDAGNLLHKVNPHYVKQEEKVVKEEYEQKVDEGQEIQIMVETVKEPEEEYLSVFERVKKWINRINQYLSEKWNNLKTGKFL